MNKGRNLKLMKVHNRALVLRTIQQHEKISRKEISRLTGLTPATITTIANVLLDLGLVIETGKDTRANLYGRKPIFLSINREKYCILAVNLGRCRVQAAAFDLAGNISHTIEEYLQLFQHNELVVDDLGEKVIQIIDRLIHSSRLNRKQLLGISIAAPGPLNAERGIIRVPRSENSPLKALAPFDWRELHLRKIVEKRFGVSVFVDNDANISALGESWFGAGIGISNFVLYVVGMGTGAGVIIDGMLYRGEDDVVSEIGHVTIDYKGPKCRCGNVGCLELYSSFFNIVDNYSRRIGESGAASAESLTNEEVFKSVVAIFQRANGGDPLAEEILREHGKILGIGAVTLANTFSPELIVVSGNDIGDLDISILLREIQDCVSQRSFSVIRDKVKVVRSTLGKDIALYGGVALALQDLFLRIEG